MIWIQAGFAMTVLSAAIKAIPDDIVEAARLDGVGRLGMFRYITLPSIRPAVVVVLTTIGIGTLKVFDIVRTVTGGQFNTSVVANEFYSQTFRADNQGLGAALAVLLFVLVVPIVAYNVRQLRARRHDDHEPPSRLTTTPADQRRRAAGGGRRQEASSRPWASRRGRRHRRAVDAADVRPAGLVVPAGARRSRRPAGGRSSPTRRSPWTTTAGAVDGSTGGLGDYFVNSLVITIPAVRHPAVPGRAGGVRVRLDRVPGRDILFVAVFALQIVPIQVTLLPLLAVRQGAASPARFWTIWLSHSMFALPLAIFLLHNFMREIPRELIEAARMDGAGHVAILFRVLLPLLTPALAAFGIFQFLWVWNDLLVALTFAGGAPTSRRITVGIANLSGTRGTAWHLLSAGAFVSIIVPVVVFLSLQRYFVRGLLAGGAQGLTGPVAPARPGRQQHPRRREGRRGLHGHGLPGAARAGPGEPESPASGSSLGRRSCPTSPRRPRRAWRRAAPASSAVVVPFLNRWFFANVLRRHRAAAARARLPPAAVQRRVPRPRRAR